MADDVTIGESDYFRLTRACDGLIARRDAPRFMAVLPWLHIINEVPFVLSAYRELFQGAETGSRRRPTFDPVISGRSARKYTLFNFAQFTKCFIRSFYYRDSRWITDPGSGTSFLKDIGSNRVDVLIITWLLNPDHLETPEDFYFGRMQEMLAESGVTSLLLMRNQSGRHSPELHRRALRKGRCARLLLPDTQSPAAEAGYIKEGLRLRRYLKKIMGNEPSGLVRGVMKQASTFSILSQGLQNLRLHDQIETVCRHLSPRMVITLYEGHAWERCIWRAARGVDPKTMCVGYQHTILRKNAHSVKRTLSPELIGYDPDVLLTLGTVTDKMLRASPRLKNLNTLIYGSHRKSQPAAAVKVPKKQPVCLVLPEGVVSESIYLFDLALACARVLTDFRFIFRMHPVLPFQQVAPLLNGYPAENGNVEVSREHRIEADFERSGYLLYRGSSTVIYAILSGLKPFYYERPGEINFDPIYELSIWRDPIRSPAALVKGIQTDMRTPEDARLEAWKTAAGYCDRYVKPVDIHALEKLTALCRHTEVQNRI